MSLIEYILIAAAVILIALGIFMRSRAKKQYAAFVSSLPEGETPPKKAKRPILWWTIAAVAGGYLLATRIFSVIFKDAGDGGFKLDFSLAAEPSGIVIFGYSISETIAGTWIVMGALIIAAIIIRLTALRKIDTPPKGIRGALELAAEKLMEYMNSTVHGLGERFGSYIFAVAALLIGFAVVEMFGIRTPASDLMFTLSIGLMTFILMGFFGLTKKGPLKYAKRYINPITIVTDIAIPMSLAIRLFGNMLAGLVIMDLIYSALSVHALGIASVIGLFFNVFHPLLQAFIFITLTLTFIREAVE